MNIEDQIAHAKKLLISGAYPACLLAAEGILRQRAKDPRALLCKGLSLFHLERYEEAEPILASIVEPDPFRFYDASYAYARCLRVAADMNKDRSIDAMTAYLEFLNFPLIKDDPKMRDDFIQARNDLGLMYAEAGRLEDAIDQMERALEIDPKFIGTYLNYAEIYIESGGLFAALEYAEKAILIDPSSVQAHWTRMNVQQRMELEADAFMSAIELLRLLDPAEDDDLIQHLEKDFPGLTSASGVGAMTFCYGA